MELYNYQSQIVQEDKKRCGLFTSTGTGKTRIALLLAKGKTLCIVPKTQRDDGNWEREFKKLDLKIDLTVISKEEFKKNHKKLDKFNTIIGEEAHVLLGVTPNTRYRNKQQIPKASQLFEAINEYLTRTKPERLYLVTATPIRTPMTVWGAAKLLGYDFNFYDWRNAFYQKIPMPGREVYVPKSDEKTKERLAVVVKRLGYTGQLSDYFDVPGQSYRTIYLNLTAKQKEKLKELPLEFPDPIVLIGKRHQVEQGILSGNEFEAPQSFPNEKLEKIEELALEFPKMVIFARYIAQIAQIDARLNALGYKVIILTGQTKDRGMAIKEAEESKECILIAQCQISSGWEVPSIPVMVFASMDYSIVNRVQAEGRILRANHLKKNLYLDLIVRGGIDEAVKKSIENKKDFNEKLYASSL